MNTSASLDMQIVNYLTHLNTNQKKAVLGVVKAFAEEVVENDIWEDRLFVAEIEQRTNALETGSEKGYSWDEVKSITRQSLSELRKHEK